MSVSRSLVNNYIEQKKASIDNKYRLKYHMSPNVGWMNDPNGLIYFANAYHLYYQAFPYRTKPGQMMWGHFVSNDLVSFTDKGIALSLDTLGENAYSGNAIVNDNKLHVFYTLHLEKHPENIRYDGEVVEVNNDEILSELENEKRKSCVRPIETKDNKEELLFHSVSLDGEEIYRGEKVFDNESLPINISQIDFRDPCIIKRDNKYYIFIGTRDVDKNQGIIVVLKGDTLDKFEYDFTIGPFMELGDMAECPSYMRINNKDVLLISGCNTLKRDNDFKNINCSLFIVGDIDFNNGKMKVDYIKEIDKGDTFYAPQFIQGIDRPIMLAWLEMWGKKYPTSLWHHGYVGAFSFPREISVKEDDIYQYPIKEIDNYSYVVNKDYLPRCSDIYLKMNLGSTLTIKGDNGYIEIGNNNEGVYLDNRNGNSLYECIRHTNNKYRNPSIRILIDVSSIEIFVEDGKEVISSRFYIDGTLKLIPSSDIKDILIKEIGDKL